MKKEVVSIEIGGRTMSIETGHIAKQAAGSVIVRIGDTVVLTAVSHAEPRPGFNYFPLMVDYRERGYAGGKIFGGKFNKREGRPTDREVLISRMTDRPIRPLWPKDYMRDVLIQAISLSAEDEVDPGILVTNGASAALCVSDLPFLGPIGAVNVGYVDGKLAVNPSPAELEESDLNLLVAGTEDAITMVEAGASVVSEDAMTEALMFAHDHVKQICGMQKELMKLAGKPKMEYVEPEPHPVTKVLFEKHFDECLEAAGVHDKFGRKKALDELKQKIVEQYAATDEDGEDSEKPGTAEIGSAFGELKKAVFRQAIKDNRRVDGRDRDTVRPIECLVGWLPRTHGSALFTRGETQSVVTVTLGTTRDEQMYETLRDDFSESFLLHYNFPSFCVGEVKPPRGPSRREIGHGTLARRALLSQMPDGEEFPYTVRVVSEITESNGSSSMATVCGGSLALMDAGVPLKSPVAGIAMGLIADEDGEFIITDILGDEDHYGDMDFKVTGTREGITALQMDIKMKGLSADTLREALKKAKVARMHVLDEMEKVISRPRDNISEYAPKIISIVIPKDKIGKVIGPGGSMVRGLEETFGVKIDINEDDDSGTVVVSGTKRDEAERAAEQIRMMTAKPEIGKVYHGKIITIRDFGVFVEILPGTDGLCHVSELEHGYVSNVDENYHVGDELDVKLIDIDNQGRLRLSRKILLEPPKDGEEQGDRPPRRSPSGDSRRGGGRRGRSSGRRGDRRDNNNRDGRN